MNLVFSLVFLSLPLASAFASASDNASLPNLAVADDEPMSPFPPGFMSPPDQPLGWMALPPGRPFPSLLSDPRDLKIGLRGNDREEIEADVGGYRSVAGWKGLIKGKSTVAHVGIEGNAYFVMRKEGSSFPLMSSDGLLGFYGEAIRGLWLYQLRFTHISAHLSDGLTPVRQRFSYTRETLSARVARQLGFVRAYFGYHFLVHTKPKLPLHSLQFGASAIFPPHWRKIHPYGGIDFRLRNAQEGNNLQLSMGLALVSSLGAPPLRIGASFLTGHDVRGQFFRERTKKWTFGLDLDF
jgi:hypothetical protein